MDMEGELLVLLNLEQEIMLGDAQYATISIVLNVQRLTLLHSPVPTVKQD